MFAVYYVAIGTVGDWVTGWTNDVLFGEIVPPAVSGWLEGIGTAPWLQGLIVDGIIAGVGAVLGFVPQMLVLFLMLSILEDGAICPVSPSSWTVSSVSSVCPVNPSFLC